MNKKLNIFQQVRELEGWAAIAFSATLLERMLPNYNLFCEVTEFADPAQYRKTLNSIWEWLAVPKAKINFSAQLEKIEELVPDASNFDNYGVYPAIDVAMSMSATILLIQGEDPQGAVVVSKLSQGGVEAFIEASSGEPLESQEIKQHPLMQWEIETQQELLLLLKEYPKGAETCKKLKALATAEGMSNIGIEI
ncbi:YjaG family protein [Paraglaciecola aquimarina]|uniref:YjaG family protein n=1 Tax=Paraglaciecola aquimarina TaxID=1235557 RepID=A0ABU3SUL3_9ALTE|nr:YjaG family protein [Paraglaciecola aquimarina]MDU0353689.1 YjaG family protein [Paraglaciecola aquimarina]